VRYETDGKVVHDGTFKSRRLRGERVADAAPFVDFSTDEQRSIRGLLKKRARLKACVPLAFKTQIGVPEQ
jgi:hypothetical protein